MPDRPKFSFGKWSALYVLIGFNITFFIVNSYIFFKFYAYQPQTPSTLDILLHRPPEPQLVDYKDFISIVLSALSIMITALGIGLAVIAIWGYGQIKDGAVRAAEKMARKVSLRVNVQLETERQSAAAARERLEKLIGLPADTVQRMAEALFNQNENGTPGSQEPPPS